MRLSLLVPLGIAAFLGVTAAEAPDANAARRTVIHRPGHTTVITHRPRARVARVHRWRKRGPRGAVVCRTVIRRGVRVTRCW